MGTEPDSDEEADDGAVVVDPRDLIVGTMSAPGWLGRIPTVVWIVVVFVVFDVSYQLWIRRASDLGSISPYTLISLAAAVVGGAATVLLPAAVIVGCKDPGRSRSWLLQGSIALAAGELIGLVALDALQAIGWPSPSESPTDDFVVRLLVVRVPVLLLQAFGLAKIGLGLGLISEPSRPISRSWIAAVVVAFAAVLVVDARSVIELATPTGDPNSAPLVGYNLLAIVSSAIILGLWAWIVTIGARRRGRPWNWIAAAGLLVIVGSAGWSVGTLVALQVGGDTVQILNWFGLPGAVSAALGAVVLAFAFLRGFTPDGDLADGAPEADAALI